MMRLQAGSESSRTGVSARQEPPYKFTMKHRWAIKNHVLTGITLPSWMYILQKYWKKIDWHIYWHRVLFLSLMSIVNTAAAWIEWLLYHRQIEAQQLNPEPVFILGHPRTGTTHLHNLLSKDQHFAYASIFHAGFPSAFLWLEPMRWLLSPILDRTRPMDNMTMDFDLPAEDEIAVNLLSGGCSVYMAIMFMREEKELTRKYHTFEEATPQELQRYQDGFRYLMKKVTLRSGGCRPLLIKSPPHIGKIRIWLKMFPRAKFVFIHRHPLEVFQSSAHMADTYFWYTYLQRPRDEDVLQYILDQYDLLMDRYEQDRTLIPPQNLCEVSFKELDQDPIHTMHRIYTHFGWSARFEQVLPHFTTYCASLSDFKKNQLFKLTPEMEAIVRQRWASSFSRYGYE